MKSKTILVAAVLMLGGLTLPDTSEASAVYRIDDTTAVIMIDFEIDASYAEFGIPLAVDHTVSYNDRVDVAGYELQDDSGESIELATTSGLILGTAPIVDQRYTVATSTTQSFTLFAIVTTEEALPASFTAALTKLPYWTDGRRTTTHSNQLADLHAHTEDAT